jgi:Predicted Zn-dependent peptidases
MANNRIPVSDGVFLNTIYTDKFKTNFLSLNFMTPLRRETAAKNALLFMVLRRGSKKYPNIAQINEQLQFLYSSSIGTQNYKRGEIHMRVMNSWTLENAFVPENDDTDVFGDTADMVMDTLFHPLLDPATGVFLNSYVEGEKKSLVDSINAKINDKGRYALMKCQQAMCKDEAYGIEESGSVEEVQAITAEALYEHYKWFMANAKVEAFLVGRGDTELLCGKLKEEFAQINRTPLPEITTEVIRTASGDVKDIVEDQPVTQGKLCLGFRTSKVLSDEDYIVFTMMNEVYGGSPSSKLFMNVREKLSLCYYCHSIPDPFKGTMIVTSGIEVDKKEVAQNEILLQLENIKNGEITDAEMSAARNSIRNGYMQISDSHNSLESWYLGRLLAKRTDTPEDAIKKLDLVTKEQIAEAAKKITLDTIYFLNGTMKPDGATEEVNGDEE